MFGFCFLFDFYFEKAWVQYDKEPYIAQGFLHTFCMRFLRVKLVFQGWNLLYILLL